MLEPSEVPRERDPSTANSVHPLSVFCCLSNVSVLWVLRWAVQSLLGSFYSTFQVKNIQNVKKGEESLVFLLIEPLSGTLVLHWPNAAPEQPRGALWPGRSCIPGPAERQGLQTQLHLPPCARHQSPTSVGPAKGQQLLSFLLKSTFQEKHEGSPHHWDHARCSSCVVV